LKVRHRLLLVLGGASLSVAVLLAAGAFWVVRAAIRERVVERIATETSLVASWVAQGERANPELHLHELARSTASTLGVRVSLIADDGTVLADSAVARAAIERMDDHGTRPEIRDARRLGSATSFRLSGTTSIEYFYSARLLPEGGRVRFVRLALPASAVDRVSLGYGRLSVGVVVTCMLLLTAIAYGAIRRLSYPVEWMTESVERAAAGDFQLDLPRPGGEEVGRLHAAVRRLQSVLLAKLAELDSERAVLSSVISGMKEGLVLLGPDNRVRLTNRALRELFEIDFDPQGHRLTDVVRHPAIVADVEAALVAENEEAGTRRSVVRLEGSAQVFELHVTRLPAADGESAEGVLALLFDITRQEALEGVRREFVANVSHELRTPLTAIKAAVETLLDGDASDPETTLSFLQIISKNSDHMGELIEDLTDLSLIETGAITLELAHVDAAGVAREVVEKLEPLAAARNVELIAEVPSPFALRADRRRLVEMLTNLADNALKFNRPGGHAWIRGRDQDGRRLLVVEDDGIGIPSSSIEMIFNRFYQVNRDGSNRSRGTGLGLAIVKHLMRLHDGRVQVKSELGKGSSFVLDFPRPT
jgi:two-component system phosphate regulon sensor histidine kinase PhoR